MATVEKISIALTQDMAALVRHAVASGEYASNSEVIRDALRDWKVKRTLYEQHIEELRRLWQEGITSGPGRFEGISAILQEAQRRFESKGQNQHEA
ncbi:MAG TPA: type II toxin-antitoxin system ParD family antitoxin [Candidatus Competibacteraceae bacterium]|nr:type II toxin-antitoxin system ParD family antitoxin [Nitrospira sp.]HAS85759.1 type II toxin-antitoxin system ParD family antitoxin [Candidatus Competibacteraceae bacterium]